MSVSWLGAGDDPAIDSSNISARAMFDAAIVRRLDLERAAADPETDPVTVAQSRRDAERRQAILATTGTRTPSDEESRFGPVHLHRSSMST
jgi:hypothetical protein